VIHHHGVQSWAWLKFLVVVHRYFVVCLVGVWQRNYHKTNTHIKQSTSRVKEPVKFITGSLKHCWICWVGKGRECSGMNVQSVQAVLVLCDLFLQDFALTWPANWHHFSIFTWYFHLSNIWLHLSAAGGYQKVTSVSCYQSHGWIDYVGDIITRLFNSIGFSYRNEWEI
jgi:hypothetical protein